MIQDFITRETALTYFYKEAAKEPQFIGVYFEYFNGLYEVIFTPPKEASYTVVKLHGRI